MSAKNNRKTWMIVGAVAGVALIGCVACILFLYFWWNQPPRPVTEKITGTNLAQVGLVRRFPLRANVNVLAWSPDGSILVAGGSPLQDDSKDPARAETLKLWQAGTWLELRPPVQNPLNVASVAFSPDGQS